MPAASRHWSSVFSILTRNSVETRCRRGVRRRESFTAQFDRDSSAAPRATLQGFDALESRLMLTAAPASDFDFSQGVITGYRGTATVVEIPATINGQAVVAIGRSAFAASGLTSVTIPYGVTSIGDWAFTISARLASVMIPSSVTAIGRGAFAGSRLTSVTIPNGVTSIGGFAFANCDSITSVSVSDSVTTVGENAFASCRRLITLTIGSGVASIGARAFQECPITRLTIPASVTSIGESAFESNRGLRLLSIPESVTSIGSNAFGYCVRLRSIAIRSNAVGIGNAFFGCGNVVGIMLANQATSIGDGAFSDLPRLRMLSLPNTITSIGADAFRNTGLTSVSIPSSVTTIGAGAFSLTALTSVTIPDSVTSIGAGAFYGCGGLKTATIGSGVTSIGGDVYNAEGSAFADCYNLSSVTFLGNAPDIGFDVFGGAAEGARAYRSPRLTGYGADGDDFSGLIVTSLNEAPSAITLLAANVAENSAVGTVVGTFSTTDLNASDTFAYALVPGPGDSGNASFTIVGDTLLTAARFDYESTNSYSVRVRTTDSGGLSSERSFTVNVSDVYEATTVFLVANGIITGCTGPGGALAIPAAINGQAVKGIGAGAFRNLTSLTSVTMPASITSIGDYAFAGCTRVTTLTIGSGVKTIGVGAFMGDAGLRTVTIPSRVTAIGVDAFRNAASLGAVTFSGNAPTIGTNAFAGIAPDAKAYRAARLTGYGVNGGAFNGLIVALPGQ
jgi:hypothetical protein